jgi:hypothetical protein
MLSARHESGGKSGKNNNKSRRDGCKFAFFRGSLKKDDDLLSSFLVRGFVSIGLFSLHPLAPPRRKKIGKKMR